MHIWQIFHDYTFFVMYSLKSLCKTYQIKMVNYIVKIVHLN